MSGPWLEALTQATAVGSGLVAGIFFAFSTFVMAALARVEPASGIAAMQSINRTVLNALFLSAFIGTALASAALLAAPLAGATPSAAAMSGGALYLFGCFLVTAARNVPMNEALARVDAHDEAAHEFWRDYLRRWTRWNHVRTIASLAGSITLVLGG